MDIKTAEVCPTCQGSGEVQAAITIIDEIENNLKSLYDQEGERSLMIAAHPFVAAYLQKNLYSFQRKWFKSYKKWIAVEPKTALTLLDYELLDKEGKEVMF